MASNMDLLNLLASGLGSSSSINALSGKTNASNDQVTAALLSALPSMLGQMSHNASTQSGATSLMSALNQHDLKNLSEEDIVHLIKYADEDDGVKILNHIYGSSSKTEAAQTQLAKQSGLSAAQMGKIMAIAAPALLTALAAAKKKQQAAALAEAQAKAQAEAEAAAAAQKQSESEQLMALLQGLSGINASSLPTTSGKKTTSSTTTGKKTGSGKKTSSAKTNSTSGKKTQDTGLDLGDIMNMASALSGGSSKPQPTQQNSGLDLGSLLGLGGGSTQTKPTQQSAGMDIGSLMGLAGSLMGGSSSGSGKKNSTDGLSSLLGTLLQGKKLF